ncbi:MAG: hypothetical protein EYC69_04385 [Bacteroidetes bacterium]|nr:MAG: hypothetical protein EYC69_04385 [Bacteroidota bacterium]
MKYHISAFLLCMQVLTSTAQPFFDLFTLHNQWSKPSIDGANDSADINTSIFETSLTIPIKIRKDVLAISPSYSSASLKPDYADRINFQSMMLSLAFIKQWKNEKYKTSFVFISRSNKDPEIKSINESLQWGGAIVQSIKKTEKLKYKFGLYYNSEFFGPFILPLAGIDWNINERLNLFGLLPGSMNLEYKLSKKVHLGFAFRSITNSYRQALNTFIRINDNHLKLFVDFYMFKKHVFTLEAGHSVLRKYKPGIRINGETSYIDFDVNDGYLIKIAYAFRFRLDE